MPIDGRIRLRLAPPQQASFWVVGSSPNLVVSAKKLSGPINTANSAIEPPQSATKANNGVLRDSLPSLSPTGKSTSRSRCRRQRSVDLVGLFRKSAANSSPGFRTSATSFAAQNFTMPALSPTMTEGNIASWKVKEGDEFAAGDVLLEIETDKASMDVEAQEDGIVMKIMQGDGTKGVQVGARIGVLAEPGDDVSKLELPADESQPEPKEAKKEAKKETAPSTSDSKGSASEKKTASPSERNKSDKKQPKQKYPLYPSVEHLVKEHKLDESAISEITATGPQGRLLKGDVLAYLGTISAGRPSEISKRFEHNSHLDLSNIKIAKPKDADMKKSEKTAAPKAPETVSLTLPVSFKAAFEVKQKVQASFGTPSVTLSDFVFRAIDHANTGLPLSPNHKPTPNELFNTVLGLDKLNPRYSQGNYFPHVEAIRSSSGTDAAPSARPKPAKMDIIDILAGTAKKSAPRAGAPLGPSSSSIGDASAGIFTLTVPKGDEKRGQEFLTRVKSVLETQPGSLLL